MTKRKTMVENERPPMDLLKADAREIVLSKPFFVRMILERASHDVLVACLRTSLAFAKIAAKILAKRSTYFIDCDGSDYMTKARAYDRIEKGTGSYDYDDVQRVCIRSSLFFGDNAGFQKRLSNVRVLIVGYGGSAVGFDCYETAKVFVRKEIEAPVFEFVRRQARLETVYVHAHDVANNERVIENFVKCLPRTVKYLGLPGLRRILNLREMLPNGLETLFVSVPSPLDPRESVSALFPPTLKKLKLYRCTDADVDGALPEGLTHFDMGFYYRGTAERLPRGLRVLIVSPLFEGSLERLPDSVEVLIFRRYAVYKKPFERLPASLRKVYLCGWDVSVLDADEAREIDLFVASFTSRNVRVVFYDLGYGRVPSSYVI